MFLPNKLQRYISALRGYLQNSILKYGINDKVKGKLVKIYNAEVLFSEINNEIIELQTELSSLLLAVYILKSEKKLRFKFQIDVKEQIIIDFKCLTALILNICKNTSDIKVLKVSGMLVIKTKNKINKHSRLFVKKLKGCVYHELKNNNTIITIPTIFTDKKSVYPNKTIESYITNPLSEVNIFI